ncbi:MAG TPA: flavin reductase, partial [Mycobacterium sp.]|nr:flavin reductase [Mycobacterium sp.]
MASAAIDARTFRSVLGQFCTGITVITTLHDDVPVGFACQSFAALSLDPPLVLFCPTKVSRSWQAI